MRLAWTSLNATPRNVPTTTTMTAAMTSGRRHRRESLTLDVIDGPPRPSPCSRSIPGAAHRPPLPKSHTSRVSVRLGLTTGYRDGKEDSVAVDAPKHADAAS